MNGLPFQSRESAIGSAKAAGRLWDIAGNDSNLFIYNAPFAPFVDPGSRAFEEPEKWGYKFFARTLEEHRVLLDNPSWKHVLSYETNLMSRDEIAETSYDAAEVLAQEEFKAGRISEDELESRLGRTRTARKLMLEIDDIMKISDPGER